MIIRKGHLIYRIVSATHEAREVGISRDIRLWEAQKVARRQKIPLKVFKKPNDRYAYPVENKTISMKLKLGSGFNVDSLRK